MSIQIDPQDRIKAWPNPYKIENIALVLMALITFGTGIAILIHAREGFEPARAKTILLPLGLGVMLLSTGVALAARTMGQLRLIFDVDHPRSLCALVPDGISGTSQEAEHLKDQLRKNAIDYVAPKDPISNLLYALVRNIVYAPLQLQHIARHQFRNFMATIIIAASFGFCLFLMGATPFTNWLGAIYALVTFYWLIRNLRSGNAATLDSKPLIFIIALSVFIPVLFLFYGKKLPTLESWQFNFHVALMLFLLIGVHILFLISLRTQLYRGVNSPPAFKQTTATVNFNPSEFLGAFERALRDGQVGSIPNRRYIHTPLQLNQAQETGEFRVDLMEESQPQPFVAEGVAARQLWLCILTGISLVLTVVAAWLAYTAATTDQAADARLQTLGWLAVTAAAGLAAYRAAHILWGRFDFQSTLYWLEMKGVYQTASARAGNEMTSSFSTKKKMINVENLNLTIWVADIETVAFGLDTSRVIGSFAGPKDKVEHLFAKLETFADSQSLLIAPNTSSDLKRAQSIGVLESAMRSNQAALPPAGGVSPSAFPKPE
jgi:hypothetical protein